jgi:cysteine desulfurase
MHTNNETGAIYDVATVSRIVKEKNPACLVFSDGVQGFGKENICPERMGLDLFSVSSHKIHGPKGVGALYIRKGLVLPPLIHGGGQEKGIRSGTENLPGIVAFGKACREAMDTLDEGRARMASLRERIIEGLSGVKGVEFNLPKKSACHILSLRVPAFRSEVLLHILSEKGIFVSSGSACSSHKGQSPVLLNFGLSPKERDCTVRLSFSRFNTLEEADELIKIMKEIVR